MELVCNVLVEACAVCVLCLQHTIVCVRRCRGVWDAASARWIVGVQEPSTCLHHTLMHTLMHTFDVAMLTVACSSLLFYDAASC